MVKFSVVTAFPDLVKSSVRSSIIGRGIENGLIRVDPIDIRDFSDDPHRKIDDYAYAGGGMVIKADPLQKAVDAIASKQSRYVIYPSPQGVPLHQELVEDIRRIADSKEIIIVCGHYEGVDERFVEVSVDKEISLGDFVLTGGELPALVLIDSVARLVSGVVGKESSVRNDSFFDGMLDHPHYTRPAVWNGTSVPQVLLEGNDAETDAWRKREAVRRTISRRPDMMSRVAAMTYMSKGVYVMLLHYPVLDRHGEKSTTAVTGLDVHDIARSCRTYGVTKFIIVNPHSQQRDIVKKIVSHWSQGYGADFCPDRKQAVSLVKTFAAMTRAMEWIEEREGAKPTTIATTATMHVRSENWLTVKTKILSEDAPVIFIFGTGHGLHSDVLEQADHIMSPITGRGDYDHLSVRSAASIILDRFFGCR